MKGSAEIPEYNAKLNDFYITSLDGERGYIYNFKIDNFNFKNLHFDRLQVDGYLNSLLNFEGNFDLRGLSIFDKGFHNIYGKINFLGNHFFIDFQNKYNQKETDKRFSMGADLLISNKIVNIKRAILQFNDKDSLIVDDQKMYFNQNGLQANDLSLKYKKGIALIKDLKVDESYNYSFDIEFKQLDIKLFKGLGANGLLSGNLNIFGTDSASFSNAKVENFSYKDYSFDSVDIEGSFNNNKLSLSDLKISKQIGLLNLSGSYSSLDEFYGEFIKGLKVKFKN